MNSTLTSEWQALLAKKAKVYIAGRDESRCQSAIKELEKETSNTALFLQLDLANLGSVKEAAAHFQRYVVVCYKIQSSSLTLSRSITVYSLEPELHILINNAYE